MSQSEAAFAVTASDLYPPSFNEQQTTGNCSLLIPLFIAVLLVGQPRAALAYDYNGFTISGDERAGWVQYDYDNPHGKPDINKGHKDSRGFYVIPKLSVKHPLTIISGRKSPGQPPPISV